MDGFAHELIHVKNNDFTKRLAGKIIIPLLVLAGIYCIPTIIDRYCKNEKEDNCWYKIRRWLKNPFIIASSGLISYSLIRLWGQYQEIRADIGAAFLCNSAKGGIRFYSECWNSIPDKGYYSIVNFLYSYHPHPKIRIAYLTLWQKFHDWKRT